MAAPANGEDEAGHRRRTSTLFHSLKKVRSAEIPPALAGCVHPPCVLSARSPRPIASLCVSPSLQGIFSGGDRTTDPAFDSVKSDFLRMNEQVHRVRNSVAAYTHAMKGIFVGSKVVADSFVDVLQDAPKPHAWQAMLLDLRTTRANMVADRGEGAIALQMEGTALRKLNEELELHKSLLARIGEREELRRELDYYTSKMDGLRSDREKRALKGQEDKPAQAEKLSRNNQKLLDVKSKYTLFNELLTSDLRERYASRASTLGPAMSDFIQVEREVVNLYGSAVRDVAGVDHSHASPTSTDYDAADRAAAQLNRNAAEIQAAHSPAVPTLDIFASPDASFSAAQGNSASPNEPFHRTTPPPPPVPAAASSSSSAYPRPPQPPPPAPAAFSADAAAWDAPPMLSHIHGSGVGVSTAVGMSGMGTDGSYAPYAPPAHHNAPGPHSPSPPPPPPPAPAHRPVHYGGAPPPAPPPLPAAPRGEGTPQHTLQRTSSNPFDE